MPRSPPRLLRPEDDHTLNDQGIGLADLVENVAQSRDTGLGAAMRQLLSCREGDRGSAYGHDREISRP